MTLKFRQRNNSCCQIIEMQEHIFILFIGPHSLFLGSVVYKSKPLKAT